MRTPTSVRRRAVRWTSVVAAVATLAGMSACTSSRPHNSTPVPTRTITSTVVSTRPPAPSTFTPVPDKAVPVWKQGAKVPAGEVRKLCPYLRSGLDQDPTSLPNAADIEGSRVGRTTVLPGLTPVGCRFWFAYGDDAIADILPRTFATPTDAHNAMVLTARAGAGATSVPNFAPGVDGISYRTRFDPGDGETDWAFVFAKGKVMVVVHTREATTSQNALYLAQAIVGKF
jgi:hypothetical protein